MVKLILNGTPYDLWESLNYLSLGQLRGLMKATRTDEQPGVSIKEIRQLIDHLAEKNLQLMEVTVDDRQMHTFQALIFLLRRHAGESVTFESCDDVDMFHIGIDLELPEPKAVEGEAGPKAPSPLAADDAAPPAESPTTP